MPSRRSRRRAQGLRSGGREGGACELLHRHARAAGCGTTRHRAFRRRPGERANGHRPSRDPDSAAARARRQPDAQCRDSFQGECRLVRRAGEPHAREARGHDQARFLRSGRSCATCGERTSACETRRRRTSGRHRREPGEGRMKPVPTRVPLSIGAIHFIGIGGIGMSGIAEIMHNLGYQVQGSDAVENANVKRLKKMGIPIAVGHAAQNLNDAHAVVYSSAVKPGNIEFDEARKLNLPLVRRAEMLAEIMRLKSCVAIAGTNGKTTTTTMVAALLDAGGLDPTVVNGGIINAYGTNARLGAGDWVVVEADESDGTFLRLPATVSVVTNVDPEHLDHFKTFDAIKAAFLSFIENLPFYGFAVLCLDHPEVQAMVGRITDRRLITYGFSPQADARALNVRFAGGAS